MISAAASPLRLSVCCAALLVSNALADNPAPAPVDRYILFGFGPFAGRQENASWQSVKQFADGTQVQSLEVPVTWGAPGKQLADVYKGSGKVVVVGLGEGQAGYDVETVAFNERAAIRDESGAAPAERKIVVDGVERLEIGGAAQQLVEKLNAGGIPARISKDAGRFLCNEMLYELLRIQREKPHIAAVYFIHVPVLGSRLSRNRNGETVVVDQKYCAEFGRKLVGALRELHPLVEKATAKAQ